MSFLRLENTCADNGVDFAAVTRWQYLITLNASLTDGLARHAVGPWFIYFGHGVRIAHLADRHGVVFGCILGIGVDQDGLVHEVHKISNLDLNSPDFFEDFEKWLYVVVGRYTILAGQGDVWRCYSDPVGMNGVVFDRGECQVASSLALCLNRDIIPHPFYDHESVSRGDFRYSLFHTRDAYAERANPNCYLDLQTFQQHRFWPTEEGLGTTGDLVGTYNFLTQRTCQVIKVLNDNFVTALPLSGGQDSRLLLAMAGPEAQNCDQCFTQIHNYASRMDATIAKHLAGIAKVTYQAIDRRDVKISRELVDRSRLEYYSALGFDLPLPSEVEKCLQYHVTDGAVVMRGHQTDLLRAVLTDQPGEDGRANLRWQLKRLLVPHGRASNVQQVERFRPLYEDWIAGLPAGARINQIDLMFLEMYYSSTVGLTFPAFLRYFMISPFNSRQNIQMCLQINEDYRSKSLPVLDIIYKNSPPLHDFPFDFEWGGGKKLDFFQDQEAMTSATDARREKTRVRSRDLTP